MILRPDYINAITPFIDAPLVKILAGVRRCGKSTIFDMLVQELEQKNIPNDNIIKRKYTNPDYEDFSAKDMYSDLKNAIKSTGRHYLFLDELQEIKGWEKVVNSLMEDFDVDIYITGSNAYLLSTEFSTLLSGRYIEIKMLPLSFKE